MNQGQRVSASRNSRSAATAALCVLVVCGIAVTVYGARNWSAGARARRLVNPVPSNSESLSAGLQVYGEHCRSCHGVNGDGKGEKAAELSVAPGDFTDAEKMAGTSDGELFWQVTKGRLPMPAFEDKLSDEERWEVVDYIHTFAKKTTSDLGVSSVRSEIKARP